MSLHEIPGKAEDKYNLSFTVQYGQTEARSLLNMINNYRASGSSANTTPYLYDYDLEKAAMQRAAELAILFDFDRPDGTSYKELLRTFGFSVPVGSGRGWLYGQAIAFGTLNAMGLQEAYDAFLADSDAINCITGQFKTMAAGHIKIEKTDFWVLLFCSNSKNLNATPANDSEGTANVVIPASLLDTALSQYDPGFITVGTSSEVTIPTPVITSTPIIVVDPTVTPDPVTTAPVVTSNPIVTQTPVVTTTPVVTSTPAVTQTPVVTKTPVVTSTPAVTQTPVVTKTPVVTSTPAVTQTPVVTKTPVVTSTPAVTQTPVVTKTPVVTSTPAVTQTPIVTKTPVVTSTPVVTPAPVVTSTPVITSTPVSTDNGNVTKTLKKGDTFEKDSLSYKVIGTKKVAVTGLTSKKINSVSIPATVKYDGITYKVTKIAAKAFKGNKKLTTITIGKNITSIGSKAFYGCTSLTKVTIKSKSISAVGKNAFYKIGKKAVISIPKATKKKLTSLITKSKVGKNVKIEA